MGVKVTSNGDKVAKRLNNIGKKLAMGNTGVQMALYKGWLMVERSAVENVSATEEDTTHLHRRTGTLAASINTKRVSKTTVTVGTNVEYAAIHEFGGTIKSAGYHQVAAGGIVHDTGIIHMPPRPYLRPALETNKGQISTYIGEYIKIAIREATSGF